MPKHDWDATPRPREGQDIGSGWSTFWFAIGFIGMLVLALSWDQIVR